MLTIILLFILGIVLVVKGGDFFVDAASWIAEVSGIPKLIIGATVVSFATTLPEMLVSIIAAAQGKVDMSISNAIGSVTANIGLIMAIALVFMPTSINRKDYILKSVLMLGASAIIVICGLTGQISPLFCVVLLVIFAIFMYDNVKQALKGMKLEAKEEKDPQLKAKKTIITNIIKFIVGVAGIVIGSDLLVDQGSEIARALHISERVIGVTLVAVGTSLPELITTLTAIAKKEQALSVGNILGANIMDLTLIMPLSSIIAGKSLPVAANSAMVDLPACLIVGLVALVPALLLKKFAKWQGFLLLALYLGYLYITCFVI